MTTSRFREFFSHKREKRKVTAVLPLSHQAAAKVDIALNLIGETLYRARRYIQMPFRTIQQREALAKPSAFFHRHRKSATL
jgi:hypothetical protein